MNPITHSMSFRAAPNPFSQNGSRKPAEVDAFAKPLVNLNGCGKRIIAPVMKKDIVVESKWEAASPKGSPCKKGTAAKETDGNASRGSPKCGKAKGTGEENERRLSPTAPSIKKGTEKIKLIKKKPIGPFDCTKVLSKRSKDDSVVVVQNDLLELLHPLKVECCQPEGREMAAIHSGSNMANIMKHFPYPSEPKPKEGRPRTETTYDMTFSNLETTSLEPSLGKHDHMRRGTTTYGDAFRARDLPIAVQDKRVVAKDRNETTYGYAFTAKTVHPVSKSANPSRKQSFTIAHRDSAMSFDTTYSKAYSQWRRNDLNRKINPAPRRSLDGIFY